MTGKNAAQFLIEYFKCRYGDEVEQQGYEFGEVVEAIQEVNNFVNSLKSNGEDTTLIEDCMARISSSALIPFYSADSGLSWSVVSPARRVSQDLNDGDLMCLQVLDEKMREVSLRFTDEQREKIVSLIGDAKEVLRQIGDSLPIGLSLYIKRLMTETETALADYDITGDFILEKAYARLRESLDIAIEKTPKNTRGRWDNTKSLLRELAVGFVIEAPGLAMSAAQVFPQIGA